MAYHEMAEVEPRGRPSAEVDVVGPVCETGDFLARDRELPGLERGERIAVLGAGAYGFVMASNYNTRPRPAEVIVDEGRWWVSRPRERLDELYRTERVTLSSGRREDPRFARDDIYDYSRRLAECPSTTTAS